MPGFRTTAFLLGLLIVGLYATGSGYWVQTSGDWYNALRRPAWQPPGVVFGLIWPYNFLMLGVASYIVSERLERQSVIAWLCWLLASVVCALVWSQQFYGPHNLGIAAAALVSAALLTLPVVILAWRASTTVGVLLLPYQVWVMLAASLSVAYRQLNPRG